MPYLPFVGMFVMATMPAALNLYWCCLSISNLICFSFVRTKFYKKIANIPDYFPNT